MSKANDLKPCPFCGSGGEVIKHSENDQYKARCSSKELCLGNMIYKWFSSQEDAEKAWNTRTDS